MKRFLIILLFIAGIAAGVYYVWPKNSTQSTETTTLTTATQITQEKAPNSVAKASEIKKVTATQLSSEKFAYAEFLGTVKAQEQVKVYPTVSGQISGVGISEGVSVKKGDILFTISGPNGSKPQAIVQAEIAAANYNTAQKGLSTAQAANEAGLRAAQLQLESAKHQAQGAALDYQVFDRNLAANEEAQYLLNDTLATTQRLSAIDQDKILSGIDDLKSAINKLEDQKFDALDALQEKIDVATDSTEQATLQQQYAEANGQMSTQLEDLYKKLDEARKGYDASIEGATLKENQLYSQIAQTEAQGKVLSLNQQGFVQKMGLDPYGNSSDAVRMAEEGLTATKVKNQATTTQAQLQIELAKLNLDAAEAAADGVNVRAPFDGVVSDVFVQKGDVVGPQVAVSQVTGLQNFDLKVSVDMDTADRISLGSMAEVKIGGRFLKTPIKSISPAADPSSKLVNVTVALPKIFFRANQALTVRLPVALNAQASSGKQSLFVPLDAVIIGTEEQYVFVADNGKARKKNVKLGTISGALAEVTTGITSSDQVIVDGAKDLVDGQDIRL